MVSNPLIDSDGDSKRCMMKRGGKKGWVWYGVFDVRTTHHVHLEVEFGLEPLLTMRASNGITWSSTVQVIC